MKQKRNYVKPILDVILMKEDIITTSGNEIGIEDDGFPLWK